MIIICLGGYYWGDFQVIDVINVAIVIVEIFNVALFKTCVIEVFDVLRRAHKTFMFSLAILRLEFKREGTPLTLKSSPLSTHSAKT